MANEKSDKTDAAALGAAVVAVAMTVFGDPSAYDLLTLIVSVSLLALILGYIGRSTRDWPQSLAFGAVLAIIAVPILGYFVEGQPGLWADEKLLPLASDEQSTVSDAATAIAWSAMALAGFAIDVRRQRRRPK
jgi:hypothetical protein